MAESNEKQGLKRSLSRAASTFLLGKKGMKKSFFVTKREQEV